VIAECFFDGHPLPIKLRDPQRPSVEAGRQEPAFVAAGGQALLPPHYDILPDWAMLAVVDFVQAAADVFLHGIIDRFTIEARGFNPHIGRMRIT